LSSTGIKDWCHILPVMTEPSDRPKSGGSPGLRIAAVLMVLAPIPGSVILHHIMRGWSDTAYLFLSAAVIAPLGIICGIALLRSWLFPRKAVITIRPRRDLLAWSMLNARWRQSLTTVLLAIIAALALLLWIASLVLRGLYPAFDHWVQRDGSTLGLLFITAIATGTTFLGAALAGRRLVRFTTGRMPMGTAKRPR
jgi:MFS family permease